MRSQNQRRLRQLVSLLMGFLLGGCYGWGNGPVSREREDELLAWVPHEGVTRREEVLDRWGAPSGSFEEGRILTYRFVQDSHGGLGSTSALLWPPLSYNLVLVFDSCGALKRHVLIRVK
jgi:hypothetical protein